jgi:hypothetical protein
MTPARLATFLGEKVTTEAEKKALQGFLTQAQKGAFEEVAVINPIAIRKAANQAGISYSKALKGTIKHERFHQGLRQVGLRGEIGFEAPSGFMSGRAREEAAEEFMAYSLEGKYTGLSHPSAPAAMDYYKQQLEPAIHRGLEGFQHRGITGIMRKDYGFGSGGILGKIMGFANKFIPKSRKTLIAEFRAGVRARIGKESFAGSALSQQEIGRVFGRERMTVSAVDLPGIHQMDIAKEIQAKYNPAMSDVKINLSSDVDEIAHHLSIDKRATAKLHREASRQIFQAAKDGGRRHTNFSASEKTKV